MSTRIMFMPQVKVPSIKTCDSCKHYMPSMRCNLFGKISLLSGVVYSSTVFEVRHDDYCGEEGRYWEPTPHKNDRERFSSNS